MHYASVSRDGSYIKSSNSNNKLNYASMIQIRNGIVNVVAFQLAQAVIIGIRYSVVREQGNMRFDSSTAGESRSNTASSQPCPVHSPFSLRQRQAKSCVKTSSLAKDHSPLPYAHTTIAALNAYATQTAADGAEDARKCCCGGHGDSVLSGLPDIVADLTSTPTLEGENYVMYQQTARYLVKCASDIRKGQPTDRAMAQEYEILQSRETVGVVLRGKNSCIQTFNFLSSVIVLRV